MVGGEVALEIGVLHREIARETESSRNTVRRYLVTNRQSGTSHVRALSVL
jgi:hypothetical protein